MINRQKADSILPVDDMFLITSVSFFLQIEWPAPQDKKRECVAKGKNNQVTRILWGLPAFLKATCTGVYTPVVYTLHFAPLHFVKSV